MLHKRQGDCLKGNNFLKVWELFLSLISFGRISYPRTVVHGAVLHSREVFGRYKHTYPVQETLKTVLKQVLGDNLSKVKIQNLENIVSLSYSIFPNTEVYFFHILIYLQWSLPCFIFNGLLLLSEMNCQPRWGVGGNGCDKGITGSNHCTFCKGHSDLQGLELGKKSQSWFRFKYLYSAN